MIHAAVALLLWLPIAGAARRLSVVAARHWYPMVKGASAPTPGEKKPSTGCGAFAAATAVMLTAILIFNYAVFPEHSVPVASSSPTSRFAGERFPQTRTERLQVSDIRDWSSSQIQYAINEMYARAGYGFGGRALRRRFARYSWYRPIDGASQSQIESRFDDVETANFHLLIERRGELTASAGRSRQERVRTASVEVSERHATPTPAPRQLPVHAVAPASKTFHPDSGNSQAERVTPTSESASPSGSSAQSVWTVIVKATDQDGATGIHVEAGQSLSFTASGRWSHGMQGIGRPYYGPDGYPKPSGAGFPSATARVGSLVCKIGDGPWELVGSRRSIQASSTGTVHLIMNDEWGTYGDNDGSVKVRVEVTE